MLTSLNILHHDLLAEKSWTIFSSATPSSAEAKLGRVLLWEGEAEARSDAVYILDSESARLMPRHPVPSRVQARNRISVICIGRAPKFIASGIRFDYLEIVDDDLPSIAEVLNASQSIVNRYAKWEQSLADALTSGASITEIIEKSLEAFGNTLFVCDSDFNIVAFAKAPASSEMEGIKLFYDSVQLTHTFPGEFLDGFMKQPSFLAALKEKEPGYWFDEVWGVSTGFVNIPISSDYTVRIIVDPSSQEVYSGDLVKLKTLSKYVRLCYTSSYDESAPSSYGLETLLAEKVYGGVVKEEALSEQLRLRGWNYHDSFICAKVVGQGKGNTRYRQKSIANRLVSVNSESVAFPYRDGVAFVQNLTKARLSEAEGSNNLRRSLEENDLSAGLGYSFKDLFSLDKIMRQAEIALDFKEPDADPPLFRFRDAVLAYVVHNDDIRLGVEYICPKSLFRLLAHDKRHNSDLVGTLRLFLECNQNMSDCSSKLFIHRSTLSYRIDKIVSITGIDLGSADDCLLYQIMIRAINVKKSTVGPFSKALVLYDLD